MAAAEGVVDLRVAVTAAVAMAVAIRSGRLPHTLNPHFFFESSVIHYKKKLKMWFPYEKV